VGEVSKPDLQVMAFVTLFVPEDFLNIPTKGSIQYHPSLLPKYRGPSAINWPIIQGDTETGLSIFWPDNGLDTGECFSKDAHQPTDTLGTVYFDRLFPMGVDAMLKPSIWWRQSAAHQAGQAKATYDAAAARQCPHID
jgi:methionyl-tRNA formyltransferase